MSAGPADRPHRPTRRLSPRNAPRQRRTAPQLRTARLYSTYDLHEDAYSIGARWSCVTHRTTIQDTIAQGVIMADSLRLEMVRSIEHT